MKKKVFSLMMTLVLAFVGMARADELTVQGDATGNSQYVPAHVSYFDEFTRAQFVIPAGELTAMNGGTITSVKFYVNSYTTSSYIPYNTLSTVDVYLKEVSYTSISAFEAKASATMVYQGTLSITNSRADIGSMTITFSTPYTYNGGNLLIGIENTTDPGYKFIYWTGATVNGASVAGHNGSSLANVQPTQQNFLPKTTFTYTAGGGGGTGGGGVADVLHVKTADGVIDTLDLGQRPAGAWMEPFSFKMYNEGTVAATVNVLDFTPNDGFLSMAESTELPLTLAANAADSAQLFIETGGASIAAGVMNYQYVAIYVDSRLARVWPLTVEVYTPEIPDVVEKAYDLGTIDATYSYEGQPESASGTTIELHDNYTLPFPEIPEGLDAVYKFTVDGDMLLNAYVDEANEDGKVALYTEDFYGQGGPMATNNYTGDLAAIDGGSGSGASGDLTVHDGTVTNSYIPFYGLWMDDFTRSEMIYPAAELNAMRGANINSMKFYISTANSSAWGATFTVYVKEVAETTLSAYSGIAGATTVFTGNIPGQGTELVIDFSTPYRYNGGNLLVGIMQNTDANYSSCYFYGETVNGASASGYNGTDANNASFNQRNFLPKTTFSYGGGRSNRDVVLNEGFESGIGSWTMVDCNTNTNVVNLSTAYEGSKVFRFSWSYYPPQYLISPELTGMENGGNLSFYYKAESDYYTESFKVGYSTTTSATSAFTWGTEVFTNSTTWAEYTQELPAGTKYIAIQYTAEDQYYLYVDNVVVNANAGGGATGGESAALAVSAGPVIENLPLRAGTYYLVSSSNQNDYTLYINGAEMPCPVLADADGNDLVLVSPADDADDVEPASVELKWNVPTFATGWRLVFGSTYHPQVGHDYTVIYPEDGSWSTDMSVNSYTVTDLFNNTNYFWHVEFNNGACADGVSTPIYGFTTTLNIPRNLVATPDAIIEGQTTTLTWNNIVDRTYRKYKIYKDGELIYSTPETPNPETHLEYEVPATELAYNMDGYVFNVTALYDEGESAFSNDAVVKVTGYSDTQGIYGYVYEQDSITPVAGATVSVTGTDELGNSHTYTAQTNADGYYSMQVLAGTYTYAFAYCPGYQDAEPYINGPEFTVVYQGTHGEMNFILDEEFYPVPLVCAEPVQVGVDELVKVWWQVPDGTGGTGTGDLTLAYEAQIGNGTSTTGYVPFYTLYDNSLSVMVYTAAELAEAGANNVAPMTSLSWYATNSTGYAQQGITIWVGNVTDTQAPTTSPSVAGLTKVYTGSMTPVVGWNEFVFNEGSFTWDGTSNLMVVVQRNNGTWNSTVYWQSHTAANMATRDYRDGTPYNVEAGTHALSVNDSRPNIIVRGGTSRGGDRAMHHYRIYRTDCYYDGPYYEGDPGGTIVLASAWVPDTAYFDVSWPQAAPGVYKWGVGVVYQGNRESGIRWSESRSNRETLTYDFEDGLQGWTTIAGTGNEVNWLHSNNNPGGYDYTGAAHGGTGFAMSYSFIDYVGEYQANNYFVSPQQYSIANGSSIDFWYDYGNDSYPDYFEVCVSTEATPTVAGFVTLWDSYSRAPKAAKSESRRDEHRDNNWRNVTIDLSAYAGQNVWVAFHHNDYDAYEVWIDDVTITAAGGGGSTPAIPGHFCAENLLALPRESCPVWSNDCSPCIDKDMDIPSLVGEDFVSVNVVLNDASPATGTSVKFTNLHAGEQAAHPQETIILDETGHHDFETFRRGTYAIEVYHEGFYTIFDTVGIGVEPDMEYHLRYVMEEILYPVRDFYVSYTGFAMWDRESGWEGGSGVGPTPPPTPGENVTVVLSYPVDIWEDGTGYQMLLDADATACGIDYQATGGYGPTDYSNFEYTIPENAAYPANTGNIVGAGSSASITIPAGTYDWVIVNPTNGGGTQYITAGNGNVGGRQDDYVFEAGKTYTFTLSVYGFNDGCDVVITDGRGNVVPSNNNVTVFNVTDSRRIENRGNANGDVAKVYNGNRGARVFEYYKVMCTSFDGQPIFNIDVTTPYCQLATDQLVEGETYICKVASVFSTGISEWRETSWVYRSCTNYPGTVSGVEVNGNEISWEYPAGDGPVPPVPPVGGSLTFGFEEPLADNGWTIQQLNSTTWEVSQAVTFSDGTTVTPHEGANMMRLSWAYGDQDEWLISPAFNAPAGANLSFWMHGHTGSTYGDHYYVKVTTDGGTSWNTLWDASAQPAGDNEFNSAITIDLSAYAGQSIKLAWNGYAIDGLWYTWFIDDVTVSNGRGEVISFNENQFTRKPVVANNITSINRTMNRRSENHVAAARELATVGSLNGMVGNFSNRDEWLTYDNSGVLMTAYGYNGNMIKMANYHPATQMAAFNGYSLTKVSFPAYCNVTGDIEIYQGGTTEPATLVYTQPFTMTGQGQNVSYNDIDLTTPVVIDASQSLWVVVASDNYTDYPFCAINANNAMGDFVYLDGYGWNHTPDVSTNGGVWMLRAYVEEGTTPTPTPTPAEGIIGAAIYQDGQPIAFVDYPVNTWEMPVSGEYCVRIIYDGPMDGSFFSMSCEECVGGDVTCTADFTINGDYYWNHANDFGAHIYWGEMPEPPTPGEALHESWESGDFNGWTAIRNGSGTEYTDWHIVNSETLFTSGPIPAHDGVYVAMARSWNNTAYQVDNWLISPLTDLGGTMTYWVMDDGQYHEHYDVYVSTTTADVAAFTQVYAPGNASDSWTQHTVDLSAYAGQQGYVAFRLNDYDQDFLFIDDVTIDPNRRGTRADIVSYNVYRSEDNVEYELIGTVPAEDGVEFYEYFDGLVDAGNTYYYQVTAVYADGCESEPAMAEGTDNDFVVVGVTGIDELNGNVALYPNPTKGNVKIEAAGMRHITVVSSLGQVLYDADVNADEMELNMAQWNTGVYVVRIVTESGINTQRVTVVR